MERVKHKVYTSYNAPNGKISAPGNEIYEWEYLDKKGELKKDKRNVNEEIQSYMSLVDYKKRITEGETFDNGNNEGLIRDFTNFTGDTVDIIGLISAINSLSEEQIAYLVQQGSAPSETPTQEEQSTQEVTEQN